MINSPVAPGAQHPARALRNLPPQLPGSRHGATAFLQTVQPSSRLSMAHAPSDPRCEAIRSLRTELLLRANDDNGAEVLALLSPSAGEGRSLLAAELAISFAQLGRPTLLVDADLRRPHQHQLFGTDNLYGLSHAIEHGVLPSMLAVSGQPQLSVLTAGPPCSNPLELLHSHCFAAMVAEWRLNYDFVIIDTAPVTRYSDALAVANLAGRVLVISRAQHTPAKELEHMLQRLTATRSQIVGGVISHF